MMLPTMRAVAVVSPKPDEAADEGPLASSLSCDAPVVFDNATSLTVLLGLCHSSMLVAAGWGVDLRRPPRTRVNPANSHRHRRCDARARQERIVKLPERWIYVCKSAAVAL